MILWEGLRKREVLLNFDLLLGEFGELVEYNVSVVTASERERQGSRSVAAAQR